MYKIDNYIIYKREVCKINDILPNYYNGNDYYILSPLSDNSLTVKVPTSNQEIRELITKEEIDKIIASIPKIDIIDASTKELESIYKKLISNDNYEDLIKIIKTTYLRNEERVNNNKKATDKDTYYFNLAEKYLYEEFSIVLNLSYDETKEYVINKVSSLVK